MTDTLAPYGMFAVDRQARTVRGILLPWGQKSRTSVSGTKPITFPRGSVTIPRDPSVVGLNRMHDRFDWLGRAAALDDEPVGIVATFRIADTDEGDAWLEDHGDLVKLSPEVRNIVRDSADFGTAVLTSAALVDEGAFMDAALFAIDKVEATFHGDDDPSRGRGIVPPDVEARAREAVQHDPGARPRPDGDGDEEDTPEGTPSEDEEPDEEPDENEEDAVADAIAPTEMLGGRRKAPATPALTKAGFFQALNRARSHADHTALQPYMADMVSSSEGDSGMFALSDVKYDGTGGLAADAKIPNTWLGELWQGRRFQRTIVPLLSQDSLTGIAMDAWIWNVKPTMATWAGNKANVPSNSPSVTPKQFFAQRYAGGHDLAREYYDFGQVAVINSYVQAMIDSYASLSDGYAVAQLVAGATAFTPGTATANKGLMAVVDGALAVVAANATPSFAVVAPNVFRDILGTPHSSALEYFNAAVNLTDASGPGFTIVPDSRVAAGQVLVGAREAATVWELPGVPIRVSAPDLVKGGIDEAFFGYIAVGVTYPAGVVKATVTIT